jgi:ATP-dependent protease ClpP protease subunit
MIIKKTVDPNISGKAPLRTEPVVARVDNTFDEEAVRKFDRKFSDAHSSGQPVVPVIIDSYGGYVHSLFSMIETIQASELPVLTYAKGKAMSCGISLLSFGSPGLRFCSPHCSLMLHQLSTRNLRKKIAEVETSVEESRRLNDALFTQMARACDQPDDYFLNLVEDNKNLNDYMSPERAIEHGIIDEIATPRMDVKVSVSWNIRTQ